MNGIQFQIQIDKNNNIIKNQEFENDFVDMDPKDITEKCCRDVGQIALDSVGPQQHDVESFNAFTFQLEQNIKEMFHWSFEILLKKEVQKKPMFDPNFVEFKRLALKQLHKDATYIKFKQHQQRDKKSQNQLSYDDYLQYLKRTNQHVFDDDELMFTAPLPDPKDIQLTEEMLIELKRRTSYQLLTNEKQTQRKQMYQNNMIPDFEYRYFCEATMINMEIITPNKNKSFYFVEPVFATIKLHMQRRILRRLYVKTKKGNTHIVASHEQEIPLTNFMMDFVKINIMVGSVFDPHRCVRRRNGLITSENDYEPKKALYKKADKIPWEITKSSGEQKRSCPWKYVPQYNPYKKEQTKIDIQIRGPIIDEEHPYKVEDDDDEEEDDDNKPKQHAILPAPVSCRNVDPYDHGGF